MLSPIYNSFLTKTINEMVACVSLQSAHTHILFLAQIRAAAPLQKKNKGNETLAYPYRLDNVTTILQVTSYEWNTV